jgi:hypothetical protein
MQKIYFSIFFNVLINEFKASKLKNMLIIKIYYLTGKIFVVKFYFAPFFRSAQQLHEKREGFGRRSVLVTNGSGCGTLDITHAALLLDKQLNVTRNLNSQYGFLIFPFYLIQAGLLTKQDLQIFLVEILYRVAAINPEFFSSFFEMTQHS